MHPTGAENPADGHAGDRDEHPTWERLSEQLGYYSKASGGAKKSYQRLKVAELVVGAAVPVVAALSAPPAVTAVLAALVVIAEGVQQLYGWQTNWVLYRGVLEALKREKSLFLAGADPYTGPERHRVLAVRIEALISQENAAWTEARTTDGQHGAGSSTTPA